MWFAVATVATVGATTTAGACASAMPRFPTITPATSAAAILPMNLDLLMFRSFDWVARQPAIAGWPHNRTARSALPSLLGGTVSLGGIVNHLHILDRHESRGNHRRPHRRKRGDALRLVDDRH